MKRRRWLQWGCAHCLLLAGAARAQDWQMPPRFARPDPATDEGGLWAMLDREETRVRRSPLRLQDQALQAYLLEVTGRLAGEHAPDLRVHPIRTPVFNASMAPNGMMQVWSGLLLRVENEAQLAAVLGHEIGHYLQRHSLERLRDAKSRSAFGSFMLAFGLVGAVGAMASAAGAFAFSREHEREADRIGVLLMRRAGYDTAEAAHVWANLLDELKAGGQGDPNASSPMFATHPPSDERRAALEAMAREQPGGQTREAEFRSRVAPLRYSMLEDELRRNRLDESLALIERHLRAAPDDAELLHFKGEALRLRAREGDLALALAALGVAAGSGREPAATHRSLGLVHRALGQHEDARKALARYLERAPDAPDAAFIRQSLEDPK